MYVYVYVYSVCIRRRGSLQGEKVIAVCDEGNTNSCLFLLPFLVLSSFCTLLLQGSNFVLYIYIMVYISCT